MKVQQLYHSDFPPRPYDMVDLTISRSELALLVEALGIVPTRDLMAAVAKQHLPSNNDAIVGLYTDLRGLANEMKAGG